MCLLALTSTEHITFDFRGTCGWCTTSSDSYCHHRISLYTTNLTTAIDGTVYCAVTHVDIGCTSHDGFSTLESTVTTLCSFTFATTEHVTCDNHMGSSFCYTLPDLIIIDGHLLCSDVHISVTCHINVVVIHIILTHISLLTTAIDIACDVGTQNILFSTHIIGNTI